MVPLALANATMTLAAQRIGGGAVDDARRLSWHGLVIGCGVATVLGLAVLLARAPIVGLYTRDAAVIAAALPLLAWVAVFHIADAAQTIAAFVLRAYKVTAVPVLIFVAALWGVGMGGGYLLAFNVTGGVPVALRGAPGFWFASTLGLVLAGVLLTGLMAWAFRQRGRRPAA